jgi:diguanylate cyclase (GGDEF)-like protein
MKKETPFEGFSKLICSPLELADPASFKRVKDIVDTMPAFQTEPFRFIINTLTDESIPENAARAIWIDILKNKQEIEGRLERMIGIRTAAIDFLERPDNGRADHRPARKMALSIKTDKNDEAWLQKIYEPGFYLEKLKEEILRAKRYKHALSAIIIDVDHFHKVNERLTFRGGDAILITIAKIINKTVRTVDILARCGGDRFAVILPNTNKRESLELSERLRNNIKNRTGRITGLSGGATVTAAAGQCLPDDSSMEFMKRLELTLDRGKTIKRDAVYQIQ